MWVTISVLITIASLSVARKRESVCRRNEVFRSCRGCETTCEDVRRGRIPKICTLQCRPAGCQCIQGYVRGDNRKCVRQRKCQNPIKNVCGPKSKPPLPNFNCGRGGRRCPNSYFCKIHPADAYAVCCPRKKCPRNEVLKVCGACDTTCKQALRGDTAVCTADCRKPSCGCKKDFYRNVKRQCVRKRQCGRDPCSPNPCGDVPCVPDPKMCIKAPCPQYKCIRDEPIKNVCGPKSKPPLPNFNCGRGGMRCPNGYFCKIHPADAYAVCCPRKKCPRNEELKICGACDTTCKQALRGDTAVCTADCRKPNCGCKEGFYRNAKRQCVRKRQCGRDPCSPNPCGDVPCVPDPKLCKKAPCPQFKCIHDDPVNNVCGPKSKPPLPNFNCGRGGRRCPNGYFCKIHPADAYAVCCPRKRISPCNPNLCPKGETCRPKRPCRIDEVPCLPFVCSKPPFDPCAQVKCDRCEVCVPDRKACFTTPCPQYKCIPRETVNPCLSNPCRKDETCNAVSCDQFKCITRRG